MPGHRLDDVAREIEHFLRRVFLWNVVEIALRFTHLVGIMKQQSNDAVDGAGGLDVDRLEVLVIDFDIAAALTRFVSLTISSAGTVSPLSASTFCRLMRLPVPLLIWWK
jgi:hypothetical protein